MIPILFKYNYYLNIDVPSPLALIQDLYTNFSAVHVLVSPDFNNFFFALLFVTGSQLSHDPLS